MKGPSSIPAIAVPSELPVSGLWAGLLGSGDIHPSRPNPIAVGVVRIIAVDAEAGVLTIDALDAFDGTPLLDIKPWLHSVDIPPAQT